MKKIILLVLLLSSFHLSAQDDEDTSIFRVSVGPQLLRLPNENLDKVHFSIFLEQNILPKVLFYERMIFLPKFPNGPDAFIDTDFFTGMTSTPENPVLASGKIELYNFSVGGSYYFISPTKSSPFVLGGIGGSMRIYEYDTILSDGGLEHVGPIGLGYASMSVIVELGVGFNLRITDFIYFSSVLAYQRKFLDSVPKWTNLPLNHNPKFGSNILTFEVNLCLDFGKFF